MRKIYNILTISLLFVFLSTCPSFAKKQSMTYHYFEGASDQISRTSYITIKDLSEDEKSFVRKIESNDYVKIDEFVLDKDFQTQRWRRISEEENSEYEGEKKGNKLFIKGMLRGVAINKTVQLKNRPFYNIPKYNLSKFALSSMSSIKFQMLRKDKLTPMTMQAKRKGVETISVNGKDVEAIKIYYSAIGIREKHYNKIYYYRKSDGIFLKKVERDGSSGELVKEK